MRISPHPPEGPNKEKEVASVPLISPEVLKQEAAALDQENFQLVSPGMPKKSRAPYGSKKKAKAAISDEEAEKSKQRRTRLCSAIARTPHYAAEVYFQTTQSYQGAAFRLREEDKAELAPLYQDLLEELGFDMAGKWYITITALTMIHGEILAGQYAAMQNEIAGKKKEAPKVQ